MLPRRESKYLGMKGCEHGEITSHEFSLYHLCFSSAPYVIITVTKPGNGEKLLGKDHKLTGAAAKPYETRIKMQRKGTLAIHVFLIR